VSKPNADEPKLVRAAQRGDQRARDALVRKYLPLVYNIVGRSLHGYPDIDDVVQETMLRIVRDLSAVRNPEGFRSWVGAVAARQVGT
jgi:RNA polymerase sigma factor (sigma-70 family)